MDSGSPVKDLIAEYVYTPGTPHAFNPLPSPDLRYSKSDGLGLILSLMYVPWPTQPNDRP